MRTFCKSFGMFCNHLEGSCNALKQSVERRPIPLDSASSTFIQCLNRRVSSASSDLNMLDSMSFGTVSFEELLGHCNEVYKKNQADLVSLEDRLKSFGYIPEVEIDEEEDKVSGLSTPVGLYIKYPEDDLHPPSLYRGAASASRSIIKDLEENPLLDDDSLSLRNLGLSDVCLANLASKADNIDDYGISWQDSVKYSRDKSFDFDSQQSSSKASGIPGVKADQKTLEAPKPMIKLSKDDYEGLPSYMKSLASWEDLLGAVEKINSSLRKREKTEEIIYFNKDEIASLMGANGRAYLLLLMRMNLFAVETINGEISYRVL